MTKVQIKALKKLARITLKNGTGFVTLDQLTPRDIPYVNELEGMKIVASQGQSDNKMYIVTKHGYRVLDALRLEGR